MSDGVPTRRSSTRQAARRAATPSASASTASSASVPAPPVPRPIMTPGTSLTLNQGPVFRTPAGYVRLDQVPVRIVAQPDGPGYVPVYRALSRVRSRSSTPFSPVTAVPQYAPGTRHPQVYHTPPTGQPQARQIPIPSQGIPPDRPIQAPPIRGHPPPRPPGQYPVGHIPMRPPNARPPPMKHSTIRSVPKNLRVDLDSLFGNPFMNLTGEPVTPKKIAIFYLVRTLFHAHFGVEAVPSLRPFNRKEKTRAFTIIYGLILMESEISYDDFRRIVRILNDELGRSIYFHFATSMEKLARGSENLDMLFEDSFYTARRPYHRNVMPRLNPKDDEMKFMSSQSYIYAWIKRVMIQYTRTSQKGLFDISEKMKNWLIAGNQKEVLPALFGLNISLPFEINCSVRAREWIALQHRFIKLCPSKAMPYSQILDWCHLVSQRHLDVFDVYLLKGVVNVQLKNPPEAIKNFKIFFDLSSLEVTENSKYAVDTIRLMESSEVALRYGPILQGRVHRLFGEKKAANLLFCESIQQAQLHTDDMCNRIANMELTILSVMSESPILEKPYLHENKERNEDNGDRRVNQFTNHPTIRLTKPSLKIIQLCLGYDYEIHTYLIAMSRLMLCIEDLMNGRFLRTYCAPHFLSFGLHYFCPMQDFTSKGRVIQDFSDSVMSSALLQSGMYHQVRRAVETMMINNSKSKVCPKLETESQAVAGVNLVYSLAALGDYDRAFRTISSLKSTFPQNINWMSTRHISICEKLLKFERDFLLNRYPSCHSHLIGLESTAPLEFFLRKSLLLASTGNLVEAVRLLKSYKCGDVRGNMRIHMQLATFYTAYRQFGLSEIHLGEAQKIALTTHFMDANFLVARRVASALMARNMNEKALEILSALSSKVENFGSFIEKAIYFITMSRCLRLLGKDPRIDLKKCKSQIINNRWPSMEKLLLTEITFLHLPTGLLPNEEKCSWAKERFGELEVDFPGACTWMLI